MMADKALTRGSLCVWLVILIICPVVRCIEKSELFPFDESDAQLASVDNATAPVRLSVPISLYDQFYDTVHVSSRVLDAGQRVMRSGYLGLCLHVDQQRRHPDVPVAFGLLFQYRSSSQHPRESPSPPQDTLSPTQHITHMS